MAGGGSFVLPRKQSGEFVGTTVGLHNAVHATTRPIDASVAPGPLIKQKMAAAGIPHDRIHIKPTLPMADPGLGPCDGGNMMYLGRLSPEKKLDSLLAAWERLDERVPLEMSGVGLLQHHVEAAAQGDPSFESLGFASNEALDDLLGDAPAFVVTSGTHEAQPMTILKAYATGTPAIAAGMGAMQDLVEDGRTGWHFKPSDPDDLARAAGTVFEPSRDLGQMCREMRDRCFENLTPGPIHKLTMKVHEAALRHRHTDLERTP